MNKNFIITGQRRTGKSSLIKEYIDTYRQEISGLFVQRIYDDEKKVNAYRLVDYASKEEYILDIPERPGLKMDNIFLKTEEKGVSYTNPEIFETTGKDILEKSLAFKKYLVVIDEIGSVEEDAELYKKAVRDVLDARIPVLGIIQNIKTPFIDEIRNRPDVEILNLDEISREKAEKQVYEFLRECGFY
ncbi:MAG: nucleoside-triphosphatase [Desulfitobacteriia bacterium]